MDEALFYAINRGMQNGLFDRLMPFLTDHDSWIVPLLVLLGWLVWKNPKRGALIFLTAVLAFAVSDFVNHRILKEVFERIRPCNALPDVHLLVGCGGSFSFPSSHAVNSFTIASVFGFYDRRLLWIIIPCAAAVAFSRVYVGVHYPVDVTVGSLLGVGMGYAAYRATLPALDRLAPAPKDPPEEPEPAA